MSDIERLKSFCESNHDCICFDGTFEDFNECCGKKYGIQDPLGILFKMVESMSRKSSVPRLRDMPPEKANEVLRKIMEIKDE